MPSAPQPRSRCRSTAAGTTSTLPVRRRIRARPPWARLATSLNNSALDALVTLGRTYALESTLDEASSWAWNAISAAGASACAAAIDGMLATPDAITVRSCLDAITR